MIQNKAIKIFTFDGGGIRGLFSLKVGAELEQLLGKPLAMVADLMAGTSTGGLEVLGLNVPDDAGKPKHSCADLMQIYKTDGPAIFGSSVFHKARTLFGVVGPKYDGVGLAETLTKYYGVTSLSDAVTKILIPSFDIEAYDPMFFKSWDTEADYNYSMVNVGMATSAAPTYFPPAHITQNPKRVLSCIDGGIYANNPSSCALAEAIRLWGYTPIRLISIGTGSVQKSIKYQDSKNWGLAGWARDIIDAFQDGTADTVDYQCKKTLDIYFRFQTSVNGNCKLDDVGQIPYLEKVADDYIRDNAQLLKQACKAFTDE